MITKHPRSNPLAGVNDMRKPKTERERQEQTAFDNLEHVYSYHYLCDDNTTFSAIAPSESGAFRVLNAERPGMGATYDGATDVPCRPLSLRQRWGARMNRETRP